MVVAQALGLQPLAVGGDDRDDRDRLGKGDVLQPGDDAGDLLLLGAGSGITGTFWR